ncbi:uncharacterized protein LOC126795661 [Argentina anserina]|uniref:uncharacterized protein LOC126795661 n=1 Tax=Argentina anserina TaxID=57926 RepID=UPI0021763522|nr:uncharacterized protein LOC126795661 [Potentilla anserina]
MFKTLFWNAKGAGSDDIKSAITDTVRINSIDMLAISEPRVQFYKTKDALLNLGFSNFKIVEANGFSGGLWLLWKKNQVKLEVVDHNFQSISAKVFVSGSPTWLLSVLYASPNHSSRAALWDYLDSLLATHNLPSLFIGDFNELVSSVDKNGGPFHGRFGGLRSWVNRNGLIDMGFIESCCTWSNNIIKERLDRGFCNCSWKEAFLEAFIQHLPKTRSDHCPILLQLNYNNSINKDATLFRFQAMWLSHEKYYEFIDSSWKVLSGDFVSKVHVMSYAVAKWNKDVFGHIFYIYKK